MEEKEDNDNLYNIKKTFNMLTLISFKMRKKKTTDY